MLFNVVAETVKQNDARGQQDVFLKFLLGQYYLKGIGTDVNAYTANYIFESIKDYPPAVASIGHYYYKFW